MKTKKTFPSPLIIALIPCIMAAPLLATNVTVDTSGTAVTANGSFVSGDFARNMGTNVEYVISDDVTLTIANYGQATNGSTNGRGTIFNSQNGSSFIVKPRTPDGTGKAQFVGYTVGGVPQFAYTSSKSAGGAIFLAAGNNIVDLTNASFDNFLMENHGGAIYVGAGNSELKFNNVTFNNNGVIVDKEGADTATAYGGAIYLGSGESSMAMSNVQFTNTKLEAASSGASATGNGGAIYASAIGFIDGGLFASNSLAATAATTAYASGGALFMNKSGTLNNIVFRDNYAGSTGGATANASGGALYLGGNTVTGTGLYFVSNTVAMSGASGAANGGGLFASGATPMLTSATFAQNFAMSNGGGAYMKDSSGDINGAVFDRNTALQAGGGLYLTHYTGTLSNLAVTGNMTAGQGAGLFVGGNTALTIAGGTFAGNKTDTLVGTTGAGQGGAAAINGSGAKVVFQDVLFQGNTVRTEGPHGQGGAIYANGADVTFNITRSATYAGNIAYGAASSGNPDAQANADSGGFLFAAGSNPQISFNVLSGQSLTIGTADNVAADSVIVMGDGRISVNDTDANTGALILNADSSASKAAVLVNGGTLMLGNARAALGGAITVGNGAAFGGAGTATGNVTANAGATVFAGVAGGAGGAGVAVPQTLRINGTLDIASGGTLAFGIFGNASNDQISVGQLARAGSNTVLLNDFYSGAYTLLTTDGALATSDTDNLVTLVNGNALGKRQSALYTLGDGGKSLILTLDSYNAVLNWSNAAGTGRWNSGNTWFNPTLSGGTDDSFVTGDIINLAGAAPGQINVSGASVNTAGIFASGGQSYQITGGALRADGSLGTLADSAAATGKLILGGFATSDATGYATGAAAAFSGTLDLSGQDAGIANNFAGGVDIHSGVLRISSAGQLGAPLSQLAFLGDASLSGTLQIADGASVVIDGGGAASQRLSVTSGHTGAIALSRDSSMIFQNGNAGDAGGGGGAMLNVGSGAHLVLDGNGGAGFVFAGNTTSAAWTLANPAGGGAISNAGQLDIANASFSNNSSSSGAAGATYAGGAIENTGTLTLTRATFADNSADTGGAIDNTLGTLNIINSTFTGNTAATDGGAISNHGGLVNITAENSGTTRFAGNTVGANPGAQSANAITTFGSGTVTINTDDTGVVDMSDPMSGHASTGNISVIKTGAGAWNLGGTSSFDGAQASAIAINAGTLHLNTAAALALAAPGSAFTLGGAAELELGGGNTIAAPAMNFNAGSQITFASPGGAGDSLALDGDALFDGSHWNIRTTTGDIADNIALNGAATFTGENTINLTAIAGSGTYAILNTTGGINGTIAGNFGDVLFNGSELTGRASATLSMDGANKDLLLIVNITNGSVTWSGSGGSAWNTSTDNWSGIDTRFVPGDSVLFNDTAAGSHTIDLDAGNLSVADMVVDTSGSYLFTGGAITTSTVGTTLGNATGRLTKQGSGILVLANSGPNDFANGIVLSGGTLQGNAATLATGSDAGISAVAGTTLVFDQAADGVYANAITGGANLVKQNTGALVLSASSNYFAGGINVLGGLLELQNSGLATDGPVNVAAGSTLRIAGGAAGGVQGALTGSGTLDVSLNAPGSLFTLNAGAANAFDGTLRLGQSTFTLDAPTGSILQNASLELAQGNTTIVGAAAGPGGAIRLADLTLDGGKIIFNATVPADLSASPVIDTDTLTLNSGTVQASVPTAGIPQPMPEGASLFVQSTGNTATHLITSGSVVGNAGNLTLVDQFGNSLGANTAQSVDIKNGSDIVATGTYNYGLVATATGLDVNYKLVSVDVRDGQTLELAPDANADAAGSTLDAAITGGGGISVDATTGANGTVVFSNTGNTYTGATAITGGTLQAAVNNALGHTASLDLAPGAGLDINGYTQTIGAINTGEGSTIALGSSSGLLTLTVGGTIRGAITGTGGFDFASGNYAITSSNTAFAGATTIGDSGTLALGSLSGLGSGAITLEGPSAILSYTANESGTLANAIGGGGQLILNNTGTTFITRSNTSLTGRVSVNAGHVVNTAANALGKAPVAVAAGASVDYGGKSGGSLNNNFSGAGTLNLNATTSGSWTINGHNTIAVMNLNSGAVAIANSPTALGDSKTTLNMTDAHLVLNQNGIYFGNLVLNGTSSVSFKTLSSGFRQAGLTSMTSTGTSATLNFNTNAGTASGDNYKVTGNVTGTYNIVMHNTGNAPVAIVSSFPLINAPSIDATFLAAPSAQIGAYVYDVAVVTQPSAHGGLAANAQFTQTGTLSNFGNYIVNTVGALPLTWLSELDTIEKRMGEIRFDTRRKAGADVWVRGHAQRLDVDRRVIGTSNAAGFSEDQYTVDAGVDYGQRLKSGAAYYAGVFLGYGGSSRTIDNDIGDGNTDSIYGGGYFTYAFASGWYLDAIAKFNRFENDYTTRGDYAAPITGKYNTTAVGVSLELGKRIAIGKNGFITPSVQAVESSYSSGEYTASNGSVIYINSGNTSQLRAGLLAGCKFAYDRVRAVQPYLKVYAAQQWSSGGQVALDNRKWHPGISGSRIEAGGGVNWLFTKNRQLFLDYECGWANDYSKPYGVTGGIRLMW